jgi:hypothetical protein
MSVPGHAAPAGPPPGGWTPSSILRRVNAVLREEGARSLGMRVVGEVFYRRMLILEGKVDNPPPRVEPPEGIEFEPLDRGQIDDYLRFRPDQPRSEIESRLGAHHVCFAARDRGELVQTCWFAPDDAWIDYLDWALPLAAEEAYVYDIYAPPEARGRHLFRSQMSAMYEFFSDHRQLMRCFPHHAGPPDARYGFVAAFHLENRIWTLFARAGLRPREIVGYFGMGRLRWRFRHPAPSEERLRRVARRHAARQRRRVSARSEPAAPESSSASSAEVPYSP